MLVLGCSGSGKSTLTRAISKSLNLEPIHLDVYFWQPGWKETPLKEWREKVNQLVQSDCWVMDGTFSESFDLRFPLADKIIILESSRYRCLYRAITRILKYSKKKRRSDMAEGCDESIDFEFYKYIWTFESKVLPKIEAAISQFGCEEKVIRINGAHSTREIGRVLNI